ncbi:MAG: hypothetical protein A2W05_09340 [Candidatus Schekmanbacteria bacterium RBG_16_38_10]|uniref:SH3b domain-containing protein n=1 Tax=Candidatus Schekmanbacteria bacterium RBG_16_38_10 TaxID=1817879 RepID=A0A1F7S3G1_9BACT|nr:MAG: hypothetical protein A2W05_09340 [Candidatus Schekmanbacteria bacterium RBG_16_38_10]
MRMVKLLFLASVILIFPFLCSSQETSSMFLDANQAYNRGDYDRAVLLYQKLLDLGTRNSLLYYNLGNCFFRKGELGKSILNYKKSELYNPRNEDLKANLNYVRQSIKDKIEVRGDGIRKRFFFWYYALNLKEIFIFFLIFNGIFWILAVLKLFKSFPFLRAVFFVFLLLMLVSGISAATKFYEMENFKGGVVLAEEVSVRSGDSITDTVIFKLHEGTEIEILDERDDWVKIKLPHGSKDMRGWLEKKFVGIVHFKTI